MKDLSTVFSYFISTQNNNSNNNNKKYISNKNFRLGADNNFFYLKILIFTVAKYAGKFYFQCRY